MIRRDASKPAIRDERSPDRDEQHGEELEAEEIEQLEETAEGQGAGQSDSHGFTWPSTVRRPRTMNELLGWPTIPTQKSMWSSSWRTAAR